MNQDTRKKVIKPDMYFVVTDYGEEMELAQHKPPK